MHKQQRNIQTRQTILLSLFQPLRKKCLLQYSDAQILEPTPTLSSALSSALPSPPSLLVFAFSSTVMEIPSSFIKRSKDIDDGLAAAKDQGIRSTRKRSSIPRVRLKVKEGRRDMLILHCMRCWQFSNERLHDYLQTAS